MYPLSSSEQSILHIVASRVDSSGLCPWRRCIMVVVGAATALKAAAKKAKDKQVQQALNFDSDSIVGESRPSSVAKKVDKNKWKNPDLVKHPLLKRYVHFSNKCEWLAQNDYFNAFIILVIIAAGLVVGLQTYPSYEFNPDLELVDNIILGVFGFEVILKLCAESVAPIYFFIGNEWGWNNFDLIIVILSLPIWGSTFGGNSVKLLRLTRLMRVMKLVKKIPQLQMIVMGLIGGLRSIVYILALLILVFYLYAIVGFYIFAENDPFHFGDVPISITTLFRMATLEDWTDVLYINYYGCDSEMWDSGYEHTDAFGVCPPGSSELMRPYQGLTMIYFLSFIVVSALVMLSLFVGAVTMSMTESMAMMKLEAEISERKRKLEKAKKRAKKRNLTGFSQLENQESQRTQSDAFGEIEISTVEELEEETFEEEMPAGPPRHGKQKPGESIKHVFNRDDNAEVKAEKVLDLFTKKTPKVVPLGEIDTKSDSVGGGDGRSNFRVLAAKAYQNIRRRSTIRLNPFLATTTEAESEKVRRAFKGAWEGVELLDLLYNDPEDEYDNMLKNKWIDLSRKALWLIETSRFNNFIIFVIIIASLLVGLQTDDALSKNPYVENTDWVILGIFMCEIFLKMIAEKFRPWQFFIKSRAIQGWNTFDAFIVIGSLVPGSGSMLTMLRLLRLLRVLKLVKSLPELQVIIVALIGGLTSISYIGVILFLVFYVFAILGMILFQENDPWHFGSLHISLFSLFRMATLEDWTDVMYINMYGCDKYGYTGIENLCHNPTAFKSVATIFFVVFTLIGALVLMTLFIGVVTTSMEEATQTQKEQQEKQAVLDKVVETHNIDQKTLMAYDTVFKMLDLDESGKIEEEELRFGLASIGKLPNETELQRMLSVVDEDNSGEIDFVEFVRFMRIVRTYKGGSVMYEKDFAVRETLIQKGEPLSPKSAIRSFKIPQPFF
mmetsp:Transcript_4811/g.8726  ORF Transcript_4811/g.8726 Transcript_4811/m.8726 type:complete len:950 (+) Transcript_4811:212-3061(+)